MSRVDDVVYTRALERSIAVGQTFKGREGQCAVILARDWSIGAENRRPWKIHPSGTK